MRCHSTNKRITKHARKRFIERIGYLTDEEMLWYASIPNKQFKFIWKFKRSRHNKEFVMERCLVTVIPTGKPIEG